MAELTAPQQNRLLAGLSNLLRRVEQDSGPEFLPRGLDVMGLVRQLALPSAETVEKMSYGDPLFRMPTQSNIPITTDRGYLAEVLGLAPAASAASRATTRLSNEAADALVRQITGNQQATAQGALQAAGEMSPLARMFKPEQVKSVLPKTKVVDEEGNPKLLYHGTNKEFDDFSESFSGAKTGNPTSKLGFFFSDSPVEASRYTTDWGKEGGNVRPVYLDIKNPKRLTYKQMNDISMALFDESSSLPVNAWKTKEGQAAIEASAIAGQKRANKMAMDLRQQLIDEGYDGAVVKIGGKDEYIAFYPNQIKSATSDPAFTGLLEPQAGARPMFETGREVTFPFIKNTEKAPKTTGFAQEIEPAGNYILSGEDVDVAKLPQGWTSGEVTFKNPLVLDWGKSGLYSEPDNWKQVLSSQYGGKTGKALSRAIAKDGYDGIVTINEYGPSEIVDLTMFAK